jgi:MoaA/NifB/PqqE/SkfB family radical SAM enzyme
MVFTNGSSSPKDNPSLPNNFYLVSVDGLEKTHDKIRTKGLYKKIWKNFSGRSDCFTSTTITKLNKDEIEDLVAEWSKTKIGGMIFYFATPIKGEKNDIFLNWEEKEEVIERLLELKRKYQDFLLLTKKMLDLLRQEEVEKWSRKCPVEWATVTYAADGSIKKPCVIGKKADCSKCGSWMAIFLESLMKFDRESFSFIKKSLSVAGNN